MWLGLLDAIAIIAHSHIAFGLRIDRKIRIPWLEDHEGEEMVWCPRSGDAELSSIFGALVSTNSVVMLYVNNPIGARAHDDAICITLLVNFRWVGPPL